MRNLRLALLLASLAVVGGAACKLIGYDAPTYAYGKVWLKYMAQGESDPQPTDNSGACEASYVDGEWKCIASGSMPAFWGVWKQNARLQAITNCLLDWDNGQVIACPGEYLYPDRVWDLNGPAGYANGQRGPL